MYSKEEASNIRQEFWTTFGQYMAPVPSVDEYFMSWINYKTGLKNVYFKMQTYKRSAVIGIYITHSDPELQEIFFQQFLENKNFLESLTGEQWEWKLNVQDEQGKITSRIYKELTGVSIMNRDDWPALISFFKERMMALDEFWSMAKYSFDQLR